MRYLAAIDLGEMSENEDPIVAVSKSVVVGNDCVVDECHEKVAKWTRRSHRHCEVFDGTIGAYIGRLSSCVAFAPPKRHGRRLGRFVVVARNRHRHDVVQGCCRRIL